MAAILVSGETVWPVSDMSGVNLSVSKIAWRIMRKPPLVSQAQNDIVLFVGYVLLSSSICLFGIVSNIINIIIFLNQGFKNSVNISLLGIAISDLGCVIFLLWLSICLGPADLRKADVPFRFDEIHYLTGALGHVMFSRVTSCDIAFVTFERCLSVTLPLKVKQIITPRKTVIVLILIFVINIFTFVPEYFEAYFDWKFFEDTNRTLLGMVYRKDSEAGTYIFILTPLLGMLSFVAVIVFTAILVFQLRQKSRWRQSVSGTHSKRQEGSLSTRDKNTIKMVIGLACLLIACNIPGMVVTLVTVFVPEFRLLADYERLFKSVWSFPCAFQAVNASVNIFFYYRMSSSYRQTLDIMVLKLCKRPD